MGQGRGFDQNDPVDPAARTQTLDGSEPAARDPGLSPAMAIAAALDELPPGTRLDQFTIVRTLGAGGMGVVYEAHDEVLERRVAVKLVLGAAGSGQQRLLREARAAARLAHPNVVSIYEVGAGARGTYIAMELVAGQTLGDWADQQPRPWPAIVDAFVAAGRGLAAAHAAGLVHRDFKPDNVLVGDDGRVRVTDFGLVGALGEPLVEPDAAAADGAHHPALTRTGAVMGTPLYMAPEQHEGAPADARADQFSFCVALHHILHGEPPFAGATAEELARSKRDGARRPPPAGEVPAWLDEVVGRGLCADPADRFASMDELLGALVPTPALPPRRSRAVPYVLAVAGAGIAAAVILRGGGVGGAGAGEPAIACDAAAATAFGPTWSPERRQALVAGFVATGVDRAGQRAAAVAGELDRYAGVWRTQWEHACRAVQVDRTWPDDLGELANRCLERQRAELDQIVTALENPDAGAVAAGFDAAVRLPPPRACGDADYLRSRITPPADAAVADEVARVEEQIDELAIALSLGGKDRVAAALPALRTQAERLGHDPLLGELLWLEGALALRRDDYDLAIEHTRQAYFVARRSRQVELAAESATRLVWLLGYFKNQLDDGEEWAELAAVEVEAMPVSAAALGLHQAIGVLAEHRGQGQRAIEYGRKALALAERLHGKEHYTYSHVLQNLAAALDVAGRPGEAMELFDQAIPLVAAAFGDASIELARVLSYAGSVASNAGNHAAALVHSERAMAIAETIEVGDLDRASIDLNLAVVLIKTGEHQDALAPLDRAEAMFTRGGDPALAALARLNRAHSRSVLAVRTGDAALEARAIADYEHADRVLAEMWGADHPDRASGLVGLAALHADRERCAQALPPARAALQTYEQAASPAASDALIVIGRCVLDGDHAGARAAFERAASLRRDAGVDPLLVAEAEAWLGVAQVRGGDAEGGRALLDRAAATLTAGGGSWARRAEIIRRQATGGAR